MTAKFSSLRPMLDVTVLAIADLSDRIAGLPQQDNLRVTSDEEYGDDWCGGQIEASLSGRYEPRAALCSMSSRIAGASAVTWPFRQEIAFIFTLGITERSILGDPFSF